jgi:hypothetical protein
MDAILIRNSTAWGFPLPYPNGNQSACIQGTQRISQSLHMDSGKYVLSFIACGRPGYSGANTIDVQFNGTSISTFTPPVSSWQKNLVPISITQSGAQTISFIGTISDPNYSTAIKSISVSTDGDTDGEEQGSYTYEQCQQAAIDGQYPYFALQNVNTTTSRGYCAVSRDEPTTTSLGTSYVANGQTALWDSKTYGQPGNSAVLTVTGALSVVHSGGQSVFSTPNQTAQPSNYLGCYGDSSTRAMSNTVENGSQEYNNAQCQQKAQQSGDTYYGLQDSTSGTNAQCFTSSDLSETTQYGKAGNCTLLNDGTWSGGGWSNAVYHAKNPESHYYLILQDDGNMCIYRGSGPQDNQGNIWCSNTNGKTMTPNANYAASKGKYGKNWIASGSTLAAGDFVGSTNGNLALLMQSDGNLVLYTFTEVVNCQKMSDGNMGGGKGANALYSIGKVGIQSNLSKLAYIDQNTELHSYPSTQLQYANTYTVFSGKSVDHDIPGAAYGNASLEQCQESCNQDPVCAGFSLDNENHTCWPKKAGMYPDSPLSLENAYSTYVRDKIPLSTPLGVSKTTSNIDTIAYEQYVKGGPIAKEYGLANATRQQKQQLSELQSKMSGLLNQLNNTTNELEIGSYDTEQQVQTNMKGLQDYLTDLQTTEKKIKGFPTMMDNIVKESDIVVLQKNYEYLFWTILAAGGVLIAMNLVKK